jgi:hypothetical protein
MSTSRAVLWCVLALIATPAAGHVTQVNISVVEPFADGAALGDTGAYERVKGTFRGELDPADPRNRVIVNLDKAPRNAAGRVEYEADFLVLRPADPARGNRKVLYEVTNRGRVGINNRLMDARPASLAAANDPRTMQEAGNGFLLRRGYTLAWTGWDPNAPRSNNGMGMSAVIAANGSALITRTIRDEMVSNTRVRAPAKGGVKRVTLRLTHEAATLDPAAQARLTVRRAESDPRIEVPTSAWKYAGPREIELLPEGTVPEPGAIYEFHYTAKNPLVLGIGLAVARDFVSFLRYGNDSGAENPARPGVTGALSFGTSLSGRFLRDFVRLGFNQDEGARKVFDGVLAHTAGAGGVFLNYEFGQPSRTGTQHEDRTFPETVFPFSTAHQADPLTGARGAVMRNDGFDPLWIDTNTSTEYWQKGASLLVTDPLGSRDIALPANARSYLIAGTQHNGTAWMRSTAGPCVNPRNPHSPNPALRALLVALDEWVSDGKAPPASRTPRITGGTLVTPDQLAFPAIPGIENVRRMNEIGVLKDWIKPELDLSRPYGARVPAVNADGNETAGVLLPGIAVPLGTHTGWNLYKAPYPEGELCDRDGSYAPFAMTRADREAKGDPRPSLEERYGDHAGYVKRFEQAAKQLVAERLLLTEDAASLVAAAKSEDTAKRFAR